MPPPCGSQHRTGSRPAPLRTPNPTVPGGAPPWGAGPGRGGRPPLCPPPPPHALPHADSGVLGAGTSRQVSPRGRVRTSQWERVFLKDLHIWRCSRPGGRGCRPLGIKAWGWQRDGLTPPAAADRAQRHRSLQHRAQPPRTGTAPRPPPRGRRRLRQCARCRGVCGRGARWGWGGLSAAQRPIGPHPQPFPPPSISPPPVPARVGRARSEGRWGGAGRVVIGCGRA